MDVVGWEKRVGVDENESAERNKAAALQGPPNSNDTNSNFFRSLPFSYYFTKWKDFYEPKGDISGKFICYPLFFPAFPHYFIPNKDVDP